MALGSDDVERDPVARLNPLDASWLLLDTADTPMHVGALLVFAKPAGAPANFIEQLHERLMQCAPAGNPWTLCLQRGLGNPFRAQRLEASEIDLSSHFHRTLLPAPGGERELGVLIAALHSRALDLALPPWECHLIEGLHDGQFALYVKLHHALMDAAGFLRLLASALSPSPGSPAQAPWSVTGASSRARAGDSITQSLRALLGPQVAQLGGAFGRLLNAARGAGDGLRAPYRAPRSVLNTPIGPQRRFATQQYPLARLARVAGACDLTTDELLLYLCGSVLRRFFKEYNALPDEPLLAAVPAQRADGGEAYGSIGFVSLATHHADPRARLAEVRTSVRASDAHLNALPDELLPAYTLAATAPYLFGQFTGLDRFTPAMFNVTVAPFAGGDEPLYLGDAQLRAIYPMFPLTQGGALAISALAYAGTLNIGFCGAHETLPGLQRMAVYMGRALEELEALIASGELP